MSSGNSTEKRILSLWLPDWPVYRLARASKLDPSAPLALRGARQGGERVVALNRAARGLGVSRGQLLTDALAVASGLGVHGEDPHADTRALKQLSDWCGRYTPWTAPDPMPVHEEPDGIFLDITGCGHLFGGEARLVEDLMRRLADFGLLARVGVAPYPGAAWAVARYGARAMTLVAKDKVRATLDPLPLSALRLDIAMVDDLARLGMKQVRDLHTLPRAPMVARFGKVLAARLDQALGRASEPISPDMPLVPFRTRLQFAEGLMALTDIEQAIRLLSDEMVPLLHQADQGARRLELHLFRTDGMRFSIDVGTSVPSDDGAQIAALFSERLTGFGQGLEIGLGIEAMVLHVTAADPIAHTQADITEVKKSRLKRRPADLGFLVDRLGNRLGFDRVGRFEPRESYIPENAVVFIPAVAGIRPLEEDREPHDWRVEERQRVGRPLRMLPCAEAVETIAEVPDGPPRQFRWRRVTYHVARSEGPERIAPEWWRHRNASQGRAHVRDYYRVEDAQGRRFWLYRDGLFGRETVNPKWFVHGVFG